MWSLVSTGALDLPPNRADVNNLHCRSTAHEAFLEPKAPRNIYDFKVAQATRNSRWGVRTLGEQFPTLLQLKGEWVVQMGSARVTGQKQLFFVVKKNIFLEGVHLGQKKHSFVVKKNLFVCLRASTAWMVSLLVKKNIYL